MPSQTAFEFCLLALGLRIQDMSEIRKRSWMTFGTVNSERRMTSSQDYSKGLLSF